MERSARPADNSLVDDCAWELFDPGLAPVDEDVVPFLTEALRRSARWFEADSASAFLVEGDGYRLAAQHGGTPLPKGTVLRQGVAKAAIDAREPLLVADPTDHPRLKDSIAVRPDLVSAMVLPLILPDGDPLGVVNLGRRSGRDPYGPGDLDRARRMVGHIALAIGLALRTVEAARVARAESDGRHLAEVGRMTAILAHEIRNPLCAIRAAAQLAKDDPDCLEIIVEESDRLETICEGFLDLSKPLHLRPEPVNLPRLLERLAAKEASLFKDANVALNVSSVGEGSVNADPVRIEQACRNLLKNAREAVGAGGTVTLEVWRNGFVVADDGPGVPKELQESLFSPFVTAKPRGTGLGLTVVRRVAEAHRGRVVFDDRGPGTAFRVDLGVAA